MYQAALHRNLEKTVTETLTFLLNYPALCMCLPVNPRIKPSPRSMTSAHHGPFVTPGFARTLSTTASNYRPLLELLSPTSLFHTLALDPESIARTLPPDCPLGLSFLRTVKMVSEKLLKQYAPRSRGYLARG